MWETLPPTVAWRALVRRPSVCFIPLAWDLIKWILATVMGYAGFYFARWDFAVGFDYGGANWHARFILPPALPSAEQLGVVLSPPVPASPTLLHHAVMIGVLLLDSLVKGGFLHGVNSVLRGTAPSVRNIMQGALQYGWRLFVLSLIWMGYYAGAAALLKQGLLSESVLAPVAVAVVAILGMAEFVTVADDVWPPISVLAAPLLGWQHSGRVLAVLLLSGAVSGLLTVLSSLTGITWLLVLSPLYAVLGTWVSATALYALSSEETAESVEVSESAGGAG